MLCDAACDLKHTKPSGTCTAFTKVYMWNIWSLIIWKEIGMDLDSLDKEVSFVT